MWVCLVIGVAWVVLYWCGSFVAYIVVGLGVWGVVTPGIACRCGVVMLLGFGFLWIV